MHLVDCGAEAVRLKAYCLPAATGMLELSIYAYLCDTPFSACETGHQIR
jgi:hypothetical protein